ncbi:hypothetical protein GALMADRAFT_146535 [Galerina marginata CBS 339.88]|uniref:Uncharacterized protein n=1 Tax=Galerina marginata (strain CBS 339.88) TaxID=685588 RepID=A0A067SBM2_GALM3|nr:hypothetical protein GALMADRAFT_146535 [Galerina marginata CBS 339.88]
MSYPNAIYSVFSGVGFLCCAIPFTWHFKKGNTGTCMNMAWCGALCLTEFINSIVWNGNVVNWAPVWCDISTRIFTAAGVEYIVQGHRFNILEDVGCYPAIYNTPLAVAFIGVPPVLIGLVTARYSVPTFRAFNRRRIEFNDLLAEHSNLSSSFYIRLMCFAGIELMCTIPIGTYFIYVSSRNLYPWISWADTHSHFSVVEQYPSVVWHSIPNLKNPVELGRWVGVIGALIFFAFFGFAKEARMNYRAAYLKVVKYLGLSTASSKPATNRRKDLGPIDFVHSAATDISIPIATLPEPGTTQSNTLPIV